MHWIRKLFRLIFRKSHVGEAIPHVRRNRSEKTEVVKREDEGAFFYLGDILRQIKTLHRLLKKLRAVDKDAVAFQGRIGARVLPKKALTLCGALPEQLPSTGMTYLDPSLSKDSDWVPAAFIYFNKVRNPVGVQPFNGDVFKISGAHSDGDLMMATSFYVGIKGKTVTPLNCKRYKKVRNKAYGGRMTSTQYCGWGIDPDLQAMYEDACKQNDARSLEQYVQDTVSIAMNGWAVKADDELQVRVRKGPMTAMLSVSTKRTPYFFKDRETTTASDGKRKRIFHIVREHERTNRDGSKSVVPEHYRGERRFKWDGSDVTITVPGLHHKSITDLGLASHEVEEDCPTPKNMMMPEKAGQLLSEAIS